MMILFLSVLLSGASEKDTDPRVRSFQPLRTEIVSRLSFGDQPIYSVAFSRDGKWLLGSGADSSLRIWSTSGYELDREISVETGRIQHALFSPDAENILCVSSVGRSVFLIDSRMGLSKKQFSGVLSYFQSADLHPGGNFAAFSRPDKTAVLVDLSTGEPHLRLRGHASNVYAVHFSPDGKWLATGGGSSVRVWDVEKGEAFLHLKGHRKFIYALAFSSDSRTLVSGSLDGTARIWDLPSGKERVVLSGHSRYVSSVSISPDCRWVVTTAWDGTVRFWNARSGVLVRKETPHEGTAWASAFHPGGRSLVTAGKDGKIFVWAAKHSGKNGP